MRILVALLAALVACPLAAATGNVVFVGGGRAGAERLAFAPASLAILAGDVVTWTNVGAEAPHTVTGAAFDSSPHVTPAFLAPFTGPGGALSPGASFDSTFDEPGTFEVRCKLHREMTMTVVVTATPRATPQTFHVSAGYDDANGDSILAFSPASLTIAKGDRVVWTDRASDEIHTASGDGFDSSPALSDSALADAGRVERASGGFLLPGASYSVAFPHAGLFAYACKLHPGMRGTIAVAERLRGTPAPPLAIALVAFAGIAIVTRSRR